MPIVPLLVTFHSVVDSVGSGPTKVMSEGQGPRWPAKPPHKSSYSQHRMVRLVWKRSYLVNRFVGGQKHIVNDPTHNFVFQNLIDGKEREITALR